MRISYLIVKSKKNSRQCIIKNNLGASFIEAALTMLLFIILVFFTIDLSRYFFTYAVLTYAAQDALDYATKLEVEDSIKEGDCDPGDELLDCQAYIGRVRNILARAVKGATLAVSATNDPAQNHLIQYTHYSPTLYDGSSEHPDVADSLGLTTNPVINYAAFLRPGERVEETSGSHFLDHPTRLFGADCSVWPYKGWPCTNETWANVLATYPLEIHLEATFHPITPGIPELRVKTTQLGIRDVKVFAKPPGGAPGEPPDSPINNDPPPEPPPPPPPPCCCIEEVQQGGEITIRCKTDNEEPGCEDCIGGMGGTCIPHIPPSCGGGGR